MAKRPAKRAAAKKPKAATAKGKAKPAAKRAPVKAKSKPTPKPALGPISLAWRPLVADLSRKFAPESVERFAEGFRARFPNPGDYQFGRWAPGLSTAQVADPGRWHNDVAGIPPSIQKALTSVIDGCLRPNPARPMRIEVASDPRAFQLEVHDDGVSTVRIMLRCKERPVGKR